MRVELDGDVLGPGHLQDRRRRVPVEGDVGVGEVVDQHDLVLAGELDQAGHPGQVDALGGRVVGEGQHHHPRLGPCRLPRLHQVVEERLARAAAGLGTGGVEPDVADVGAGEQRGVDVDGVGRRRAPGRCHPGPPAPTSGGRAPLWRRWWSPPRCRGPARPRTCAGRDRRWPGGSSGCPGWPSTGGCAGCGPASASFSTATSGEGRSGLPKPRSMTSRPSRRATAFRSLMVANTYGGRPLIRRNSMPPRLLPDSPADAHPAARCRTGPGAGCRRPGGRDARRTARPPGPRSSSDSGQAQTAQVAPAAASSTEARRDLRRRPADRPPQVTSIPVAVSSATRSGLAVPQVDGHAQVAGQRRPSSGSPPPTHTGMPQAAQRRRPRRPAATGARPPGSKGMPKASFSGRLRWSPVPSRRSSGPC